MDQKRNQANLPIAIMAAPPAQKQRTMTACTQPFCVRSHAPCELSAFMCSMATVFEGLGWRERARGGGQERGAGG